MRHGELVAAVGAVTTVHLGDNFEARTPFDLLQEASKLFTKADPEFRFSEAPVEFIHKKQRRILFRGSCRVGEYEVVMWHGFLRGMPGTDESAAISRTGRPASSFASISAQLLEADPAELIKWPSR